MTNPPATTLYSARLHWWIYHSVVFYFLFFIGFIYAGLASPIPIEHFLQRLHLPPSSYFYWLIFTGSFPIFIAVQKYIVTCTTHIAITESHVVLRSGWLSVQQMELPRNQIESTSVQQNFMGRIFDFGDITFFGTGGGSPKVYGVANPREFTRRM
jgi:uncharacterized membrane protein YdbT with pleckstrin-like domain